MGEGEMAKGRADGPDDLEVSYAGQRIRLRLPDRETDPIQGRIASEAQLQELELLRHAASWLAPGDLVVDVGAHIGNHSVFYAKICGARVIALEPRPGSYETLVANLELNGVQGAVRAIARAAGSCPGRAPPRGSRPDGADARRLQEDPHGPIEVVPLDDLELGGPARLLKIDAPGRELEVLDGAERLLREHRPRLYVKAPAEEALRALLRKIAPWGYAVRAEIAGTGAFFCVPVDPPARDLEARSRGLLDEIRSLLEAQLLHSRRIEAELVTVKQRLDRREPSRPRSGSPDRGGRRERSSRSPGGGARRRKLRKLQRDPRAFFADSKHPPLRALAKLIPR